MVNARDRATRLRRECSVSMKANRPSLVSGMLSGRRDEEYLEDVSGEHRMRRHAHQAALFLSADLKAGCEKGRLVANHDGASKQRLERVPPLPPVLPTTFRQPMNLLRTKLVESKF